MREIKFRAYNWTTRTMETVEEITYNHGEINQINTDKDRILFPDEECDLMQYTGLKDKNGKEIYEGDVATDGTAENTSVIEWGNGKWMWRSNCFLSGFNDTLEVIGNIYENPELLHD